ncbi:hypothetical protein B9N43_13375 [Denitratisoma sp. DHT3]|nr:hypothetical protein B9N43_13375 [Denitratisoma sp. DHT3]
MEADFPPRYMEYAKSKKTLPLPAAHGRPCTADRLRRRKAVLCEIPPPPLSPGEVTAWLAALEVTTRSVFAFFHTKD